MKLHFRWHVIPPFLLISTILFIIIIKAICVPITHDEYSAALYYPTFSFWQIMKYPDVWPSNHILNSIFIKLSIFLFGITPFTVRMPNVISFLLYAAVVWNFANRYFQSPTVLYYAVFICFLCNPYLIDFFGLARGYGMSNAFMITSIFFCLRSADENKKSHLLLAWLFAALAAYANFTLLIFFVSLNGILILILWRERLTRKIPAEILGLQVLSLVILTFLFAIVCYTPIHKMQSTDQFVYWTSNGFFRDTVLSLVENSRYGVSYFGIQSVWFSCVVVLLFVTMFIAMLLKIFKNRFSVFQDLFVVTFAMLLFTIVDNIIQTVIIQTPNLTGRTALSFYPLFITPFLFGIKEIRTYWPRVARAVSWFLIGMGIFHVSTALRMNQVREWWYDQNTYTVLNYLNEYRMKHNQEKVQLNTSWWFNPSFTFYTQTGKVKWLDLTPYHKDIDSTSNTQFYYIMDNDWNSLQNHYDPVLKFDGGARMLLQHK
ncbi:MAG: glycosyltransferase family 39 protein [Chitinophagales bacterium]